MTHKAAVLGASGYAGGQLVRLLDGHPSIDVVYLGAHSWAGQSLGSAHPQLGGGDRIMGPIDVNMMPEADMAFLALPHGESWKIGSALVERGVKVVDLGSDFRLDSDDRYVEAYGQHHPLADDLSSWVYGLPELFGPSISAAGRVAAPGCYPTSALLALAPLVHEGIVEIDGIVVDAISGVSGAGRKVSADLTFGAVAEGVRAYGVFNHRHRPEIEAGLEAFVGAPASIVFTPHLAPMQAGLLSTCYGDLAGAAGDVEAVLKDFYVDARFVDVIGQPPQTRWVVGSNRALLSAHADERTGKVIVLSAIDNLGKGAAGQAVQCANLMLGEPEDAGLTSAGWLP
ncbi:MAG: N-acetyl-gamma-glutamyl-phosphate reductase [Acidimicrobiia bacterium]|nr:N-acetyl-gamma-glutamyl-phosphate reductase [Acidimicrobiia bacterium]NNL27318.1 N-acetyl-gamma-glutamyl-phosphate reductase [Acidimicrobiia bacterium]